MKKLFFLTIAVAASASTGWSTQLSNITDSSSVEQLDSIIVSATRADANTPVAYTTLNKERIENNAASHSLPMILGLEPSVVATTEGGLGLGCSKFSVRGSDATRTNITLNGIAINDAESQEVFWVNLPSLATALQSVQLQRGVGTSVNGPGAFGATMNMQTISPQELPYGNADFSFGSYSTFMNSFGAGTGEIGNGDGKFFADVRYSHNTTDGYIRNAKAKLDLLFLQTGWKNHNNMLKLIYIYGDQHTGITWEGCPIETYYSDRRYNVSGEYYDEAGNVHYYDNETDNYKQHHVQLSYVHRFSNPLSLSATLHYTKGDGYYENYIYNGKFSKYGLDNQTIGEETYSRSDFIINQSMDNSFYAANVSIDYSTAALVITGGVTESLYDGDHFGLVLWSKYNALIPDNYEYYRNNGTKNDLSMFVKTEYEFVPNLVGYLDLQYRNISYKLDGLDKDFVSLNDKELYNFFNPKAGLNYRINDKSNLYFSVAVGHKEPSRSDIKESIKAGSAKDIRAERMIDYELGYKFNAEHFTATVNLYAMEYKDQLVATGRLTETGYTIQENIPESYRRGVELTVAYRPTSNFTLSANATLSKNKLRNYTLYTDTNDNPDDWNPVEQTATFYKRSNLTLSPEFIGMISADYSPATSWYLNLNFKQVGKQFLDNSGSDIAKVPAYGTLNFKASKEFKLRAMSTMKLSFYVDNLLNNKYYSYGWIYTSKFADGSPDYVEKAVYAQAGINFMVGVSFSF